MQVKDVLRIAKKIKLCLGPNIIPLRCIEGMELNIFLPLYRKKWWLALFIPMEIVPDIIILPGTNVWIGGQN
jgi:hypothetical protein